MLFDHERIARVAYAAIRQLREEQGHPRGPVWELLVTEERAWYRAAVHDLAFGVRLAAVHDEWRARLEAAGWTYGPDVDHVKKTHPGLVPWSALPEPLKRRLSLAQMITMALCMDMMSDSSPVTSS
jgi:hypothetical protein